MGPGVEPHHLREAWEREAVAPLGEDAQQAAGQQLPSVAADKRDRVVGTGAAWISNQVQGSGSMQQFIDEATTRDKYPSGENFRSWEQGIHKQLTISSGDRRRADNPRPQFFQRVLHAPLKELLARSAVEQSFP